MNQPRLTPNNIANTVDSMHRLLITLTLLFVGLIASIVPANARMARPDVGMGPSNYGALLVPAPPHDMPLIRPDQQSDVAPTEVWKAIMPRGPGSPYRVRRSNQRFSFWIYMTILSAVSLGGAYLLGRQVLKRDWKVGYTRKTQALVLYFLPYVAMQGPSPYAPMMTASLSLGVFILLLMALSAPVRTRLPAMATAFASIDRPEDRPFTLTWLITSVLAAWLVILLWLWVAPHTAGYLFVALFISGVGDALAEPVGLRFGRHSYTTKALGTDRTYIRTYEGSATVLLSGVVAVLLVHGVSLDARGLAALLLFPIAGALAEAKSPHTWDQPFIIGVCALVAVGLSAVFG